MDDNETVVLYLLSSTDDLEATMKLIPHSAHAPHAVPISCRNLHQTSSVDSRLLDKNKVL